jgi:methylated-DNA-[protein]-cysteine S-methyltransferase
MGGSTTMIVEVAETPSPIGAITVVVAEGRVCALHFSDHWPDERAALERRFASSEIRHAEDPSGVCARLQAYFAGEIDALAAIDVDPAGTAFQLAVWTELRNIPAGQTASYADVARAIGAPSSVRAVGAANGSNPISLIEPCHRVIGSDGRLVGYGGGIERKRWLLQHEGAMDRHGRPAHLPLFRTPLR